jgi:gliding motility-associated-like protein
MKKLFHPDFFFVKRILFFGLFFVLAHHESSATHNRAGEITYRCLGGLTYEITITTYAQASSGIPRPDIPDVHFGDGFIGTFPRINNGGNGELLPNDILYSVYRMNHNYPGSGEYDIFFVDPNRNANVVNIPNSVLVPFAVHAWLIINPNFSCNNSVQLLSRPIDHGCVGVPFVHYPAAYDPDGDSLSFEIVACRGDNNQPIPGYTFPLAPNSFGINSQTGELVWDYPPATGNYIPEYEVNVAFEVKEWRYSQAGTPVLMGVVERDMQITISSCNNHPPQIAAIVDTCVLANSSISFDVTAIDPENDLVALSASGGPLAQVASPQAQFSTNPSAAFTNDTVVGTFSWSPSCNHVRKQPYQVLFKSEDSSTATGFVRLVDFESFFIRVIAPAPTNLTVTPLGNSMVLQWDPEVCTNATGYKIYHRSGAYSGTIQCPCETGVPSYTGYSLVGQTSGINSTTFTDNNQGQGLAIGILHCYIVIAVFADGSESCASNQACGQLKKELPVITNVSVNTTAVSGEMYVAWSKPSELDTMQYPGPYQYKVHRAPAFNGGSFVPVATIPTTTLDDTIYADLNLNTDVSPFTYYVELYYDSSGTPALKGKSTNASSIFLTLTPTDQKVILNWEEHVPWGNYRYVVYRYNGVSFDSIAEVNSIPNVIKHSYADSNLANGTQYCYKIKSVGTYSTPGILDTLINYSEEECAIPIDNLAPCPPQLSVFADCNDESNFLSWTNPNLSCADDVIKYYIYYSPDSTNFEVIGTTIGDTSITFSHNNLSSVSGCYKVTAFDSAGNESQASTVCIDTCRQYVLPSVFTPNGDGLNDLFHPCDSTTAEQLQKDNCPPYKNVKDIDMKIFDRWGLLVFQTSDKNVNWNGKNQKNKKDCPEGVYYYTCTVNFFRLNGTESMELNGYVHLIRGK